MSKVIIFGDSTTQSYTVEAFPRQGWAHYLPEYLKDGIEVKNFAHAGYSLKRFLYSQDYIDGRVKENELEKSLWYDSILPEVSEDDIVIFYWAGVNDMMSSGRDSYREAAYGAYVRDWQNTSQESYIWIGEGLGTHTFFTLRSGVEESAEILKDMLCQIRKRKAIPVVVKGTGKYYKVHGQEKNVVSVCRKYSDAVIDAAKACCAEHFDIGTEFEKEFRRHGYEKTLEKYLLPVSTVKKLCEEKGIEKKLPEVDDNVHYNYHGAEWICRKLVEQIRSSGSVLKEFLR